nr:MAG TPA: hypothetical protein [Caudoviricetes sp.]
MNTRMRWRRFCILRSWCRMGIELSLRHTYTIMRRTSCQA